MAKQIIQFIVLFVILLLVQVLVCNNISLFHVATPFIFVYVLFRLPINIHVNWLMAISFAVGLLIDIFSDTYGMNALACTVTAALRNVVLRLYVPRRDEITDPVPSIRSLGTAVFMKYLVSMTFCYCALIVTIELFSTANILHAMLRVICSTALSFVLMLGIDSIVNTKNEKGL